MEEIWRSKGKRAVLERWRSQWSEALQVWSPYTRLSEPLWSVREKEDKELGLVGSFACIRINDHSVRISLSQVEKYGLQDYGLEILAHEIGHHVFCPANLQEAGRAVALASLALPGYSNQAPAIVNMWEDLLINDRLVRLHQQRHAHIYQRLNEHSADEPDKLWSLYMRAFEILWGLKKGRLCSQELEPAEEGDAYLVARMVRVYGKDWIQGVGGFAALCLPYLERRTEKASGRVKLIFDTDGLGEGCEVPLGLMDLDGLEII
ncbi:MAG: VWA domain-containing protein, partial [Candidatus Eremiobacteraeota bacterium]|nr:VWA domain-containing protein [Candidatus Eremiobacteraeota bacterium]